ncbi:MAG: response regulator [Spirochaetes bacterium]|nr:response regulator [Spirochaetota bacterium]
MADKKLILLIDDDIDIIDSVKIILEKNGFSVDTAMSGKEGIEAAMKNKPDLILCDMMMESIDAGTKVAHDLSQKNLNVPIYLLSSIGDATASNVEIDSLGFRGVFQKPIQPDQLVKSIRKALGI